MKAVLAPNVGHVVKDDVVYASVLPDGPIFVLVDDAAAAWRVVTGTVEVLSPELLADYVAALADAGLLIIEKES